MSTAQKLKLAGLAAALVPIGFFLLFAVGEGAMGWSHYLQAAVPLLVLVYAWIYPRLGGDALMWLGGVFGVWYVFAAHSMPLVTISLIEVIVAAPVILSGYLFRRSVQKE